MQEASFLVNRPPKGLPLSEIFRCFHRLVDVVLQSVLDKVLLDEMLSVRAIAFRSKL